MGKCVEIDLADDGTYSVSECPPKEEAMPGEEGGEGGQTFDNAEDAMAAAMELLSSDRVPDEMGAQTGYDKGAKPMMNAGKPKVAAVFGE